jgi:predicted nucleic acid-binding protein
VGEISSAVNDKLVAFDSAPLIYYLETHPGYSALSDELFGAIREGHTSGLTSTISLMEVLVLPLRHGRTGLAEQYRRLLLHTRGISIIPVDSRVCEIAAELRARHTWLRTPDALQVGTALAHGADLIVTNDEHWKRLSEVPVIVLKDYT